MIAMTPSLTSTAFPTWLEAIFTDVLNYITNNLNLILTALNLQAYATAIQAIWPALVNYLLSLLHVPTTPTT